MNDKEPAYLMDKTILPWHGSPEYKRIVTPQWYDGTTNLVRTLGFVSMNEEVGPFRVVASAARCVVDLMRTEQGCVADGETVRELLGKRTTTREVLFSGSIAIYSKGHVPGTALDGEHLLEHERIWVAKKPLGRFSMPTGLHHLIRDAGIDPQDRIENILLGYRQQREELQKVRE